MNNQLQCPHCENYKVNELPIYPPSRKKLEKWFTFFFFAGFLTVGVAWIGALFVWIMENDLKPIGKEYHCSICGYEWRPVNSI